MKMLFVSTGPFDVFKEAGRIDVAPFFEEGYVAYGWHICMKRYKKYTPIEGPQFPIDGGPGQNNEIKN